MSLAAAGAGGFAGAGGAGGLVMDNPVNAMARAAAPQPPPGANNNAFSGGGTGAPPSAAALGADLLDRTSGLSMKQVRNLSHLPLVAVDLYASDNNGQIAMFPPKPKEDSPPIVVTSAGFLRPVVLQPTETAHKTLRKWLAKSKGYDAIKADALAKENSPGAVTLTSPQEWLGIRRLKDVAPHIRESFPVVDEEATPAISEDTSAGKIGVSITNGTLDGVSPPTGDDFDRVVYKVRLTETKKALIVLPEEAVALQLAQAQYSVARKFNPKDEEVGDYPLAVALPAWACNDASVEALLDATNNAGVAFQRSIAACAGALLPGPEESPNAILKRLNDVRSKKHKECLKEDPEATSFEYDALLLLIGLTKDGIECTAVQVSNPQPNTPTCLFGHYNVLTSVSYPSKNPALLLEKCVNEIMHNLEEVAPEADGPVAVISYGTIPEQLEIKKKLSIADLGPWKKVPQLSTRPECVAVGTAILGAVSHGRVSAVTTGANGKPKAKLAIRIQNVAPSAVGIRTNYHGGKEDKWTPVKVIFDFDRRTPAGPYPMELTAVECAAHRNSQKVLSGDDLFEETKKYEGSKGIPKREEASLNFRLQVVQKWTRTGEWKPIGNVMSPITIIDVEDDGKRTACESAVLELSLGSTGITTCSLVGDG